MPANRSGQHCNGDDHHDQNGKRDRESQSDVRAATQRFLDLDALWG